ncbi:hypothetical protein HN385_05635 [archaeon]|jgi:hypothetical protein|nr:hypothetical protein [archaeon]MBT3451473.1 hypothetical protein [archaeon]MBT6868533.1 hypothetical protein [archaeon]MBT7193067.1 hypothetical protein [archaeon]MBT7381156.1 hypothetical protein [archaeon]
MVMKKASEEYRVFQVIQHFLPLKEIKKIEEYVPKSNKYYPLFIYLYNRVVLLCNKVPLRKNGDNSLLHPLSVMHSLKLSGVNDVVTYCIALSHDYVEDMVDLYAKKNNISNDNGGNRKLRAYEKKLFAEIQNDLKEICKRESIDCSISYTIIKALNLLTRHKGEFYYVSISEIFNCDDEEIKERALQVKLADATHNIHCVETFDEPRMLYTCFKNLFILNSTKDYLVQKYGKDIFYGESSISSRKLFAKCAKATFGVLIDVCDSCKMKRIVEVIYILELAFKKYVFIKAGLGGVTDINPNEPHPMRLYQAVIRKYDHRLHHEYKEFDKRRKSEMDYCKKFFKDFKFNDEQLKAIINYKDAYALKEVMARLLYQPKYYLTKFISSELSMKGRIRKR